MLALIKNEEMIALDLQHRSLAVLRVVVSQLELSNDYESLREKIDAMERSIWADLSTEQWLKLTKNNLHMSQVTTVKVLIDKYNHLQELKQQLG